jgi:ureidoglycolate hydrolase
MILHPALLTEPAFRPFGVVLETPRRTGGAAPAPGNSAGFPQAVHALEQCVTGPRSIVAAAGLPFLLIVAADAGGRPAAPHAFYVPRGKGVRIAAGHWCAAPICLAGTGRFLITGPAAETRFCLDTPFLMLPRLAA